ncbi:ribosome recycling factor [Candidatus Aerophobetes bacterium]|uniref:Ribosome-recycling factor n=1 Tax=Aerophobetes bacterium TaxID=2030807 RepID=A0A2A4X5F5_UNCAE|nr:MAG: ribosome recycling factor [Candidatus Aerophobetes bacterium]
MSIIDAAKLEMGRALDHLKQELSALRTNRPSTAILEGVLVDVYGSEMRIKDIATLSLSESRQIIVSAFDPSTLPHIGKGIEKANLGLQFVVEANMLRVMFPEMSEEVRASIAKDVKDKGEKAKITIRDCRRKANDDIKKQKTASDITEDDKKKLEKDIQNLTDDYCKQASEMCIKKEKEIMTI